MIHTRISTRFPPVTYDPDEQDTWLPCSRAFLAVLATYHTTGGTLRASDLSRLLTLRRTCNSGNLDELMQERQIFGFPWNDSTWIPMFQFDGRDLAVKSAVSHVRIELGLEFDDWSIASWFARRNVRIDDLRPVEVLEVSPQAVLDAARADCLIGFDAAAGRHALQHASSGKSQGAAA